MRWEEREASTLDKLVPLPPAWSPHLSARAAAAKYCSVQGTLLPRTAPQHLEGGVRKSTRCLPHAAPSPDALPSCSPRVHPTRPCPPLGIQMTRLPEGFSGRPKGGVPHCPCCHSLRTTLRARGPQSGTAVLGWQQLSCSFQQPEGKGQECLAFAQPSLARGQSFM